MDKASAFKLMFYRLHSNALINPVEEVPKTIQLLAATTFVQEVDSPTLALMAPLLSRGLTEKLTSTLRKVATIIVSRCARFEVPTPC